MQRPSRPSSSPRSPSPATLLSFWLRYYSFWIAFFFLFRALIIRSLWSSGSLYTALRYDVSAASFFAAVPFALSFLPERPGRILGRALSATAILIASMLGVADMVLPRVYGSFFGAETLHNVFHPEEFLASTRLSETASLFAAAFAIAATATAIYWHASLERAPAPGGGKPAVVYIASFACALPFLGIEGRVWPLSEPLGKTYANGYIRAPAADACINGVWYLCHDLLYASRTMVHEFYPAGDARRIVSELRNPFPDRRRVLGAHSRAPVNVVWIVMEGFSSDLLTVRPPDGTPVVPNLSSIAGDGLSFTSIYSAGYRTEQGFTSLFCGLPARPGIPLNRYPDQLRRLPSVADVFRDAGYSTSIYFAAPFAKGKYPRDYLARWGFLRHKGKKDFPRLPGWGWPADSELLQAQLRDMAREPVPFFSVIVTSNPHPPFPVPGKGPFPYTDLKSRYMNAAWFLDKQLGEYFEEAKKCPWYENTLFVITADHGNEVLTGGPHDLRSYRRIPLILYGAVLDDSVRGTQNDTIGNLHDLPAAVLRELGLDAAPFVWSNDLLDAGRKEYAFLASNDDVGWVSPDGYGRFPLSSRGARPEAVYPLSYLQMLYEYTSRETEKRVAAQ